MASGRFIDTNVFLKALTGSEPDQAEPSRSLLLRVEAGLEKVSTSPLVLFEVIFTLHSKRSYNYTKERIVELLIPIIEVRDLQIQGRQVWLDALDTWLTYPIDFADAYNVAFMRAAGIKEIYAWDRGYNYVKEIKCIEPSEAKEEDA